MLEALFRSKAEVKILGVALFNDGLHLREIARAAGVSSFEAKRELDSLVLLGVLVTQKKGNLLVFSKNASSPILGELTSLYLKTEGAAALIRNALSRFASEKHADGKTGGKTGGNEKMIEYAFVYGSFAKQSFTGKSDVDLLVVGGVGEEELADAMLSVQKKIGRPVNFVLWSENDFRRKLMEKSSFFKSLVEGKRIWLAGDENGFKRIAEKALG